MADFYDPISDAQTQWASTGPNHYSVIDDGIRNPSQPTLTDYVSTNSNNAIDEWGFPAITGSPVEICAWLYCETKTTSTIVASFQQGGVERAAMTIPINSPKGWRHCCWMNPTGDLSTLTIEAKQVKSGASPTYAYVYAAYLRAGPNLDVQVAATGDDGRMKGGYFSSTDDAEMVGYDSDWGLCEAFARWIGVTIEGTIDVSYMQCFAGSNKEGTPQLKVYGIDEDNPAAPTSAAQFNADPETAAGVDWDGLWTEGQWNQSPSLNSIFQELVDTYTISNEAVMVQIQNDGGTTHRHNECYFWDFPGNVSGPKLHIEYTAGGVNVTVDAVLATATAASLIPTVTGGATISGILATATAAGLVPVVSGGTGATVSGELAEATAAGLVPVVSGGTGTTVSAVLAEAIAAALLPTITGGATITGVLAEAAAAGLVPTVTGGTGATVSGELAMAIAAGLVPVVTGGTGATVSAVLAEAIAAALVPTVTGGATVSAEIATAIAETLIPVVTGTIVGGATVYAVVAEAIATALTPIVTGGLGVTVSAALATAIAEALAPRILTLFIQLTLDSRSTALTLESRSFALTLEPRSFALTLPTRE